GQAAYSSFVCFFDLVVGKARLRYCSLLLTTNFKVALQVESTIRRFNQEVQQSIATSNYGTGAVATALK
ncbi:MAG: hypothetical protein ACR2LM_15640, partial [Pyrinomonadaceae bacterium]